MSQEHYAALQILDKALVNFLESGEVSEKNSQVDGGYDPNELACEAIEDDGYVKKAVCALQSFYGGKLPAPDARNPWRALQRTCRHETDLFKRQNDAHAHAGTLRNWIVVEIERLKSLPKQAGRRGPKQKNDPVVDEKLVGDWNAAYRNGAVKKDFCDARGITVKELTRALGRVRARKSRAQ